MRQELKAVEIGFVVRPNPLVSSAELATAIGRRGEKVPEIARRADHRGSGLAGPGGRLELYVHGAEGVDRNSKRLGCDQATAIGQAHGEVKSTRGRGRAGEIAGAGRERQARRR